MTWLLELMRCAARCTREYRDCAGVCALASVASNEELARKLAFLEKKYDAQFKFVFDAIRELMTPPDPKQRPIGFGREDE